MNEPGNYSMENMLERAQAALHKKRAYVSELLGKYDARHKKRRKANIPVIGFMGMGRAGKDTAAEFYCHRMGLAYPGSSSRIILPVIAEMIGVPEEQAWQARHDNRLFWIDACHAVRHGDYTKLLRMALGSGDVAVGVRGRLELYTAIQEGVIDYNYWIDNPRVPKDPTVEFGPDDCDALLPNYGSLHDFYRRLDREVEWLLRPKYSREKVKR
jgi:hypothetical protein